MANNGTTDNGTMRQPLNGWLDLIIRGLPNFLGLVVSLWLMYQIVQAQALRNSVLTDALIACAAH